MARNQGGNTPEFSVVDVRPSDLVKDGNVWRSIAFALVKQRNNTPPDPSIEVAILLDGKEVGRRFTDEHGRIEMEVTLPDPRRYYLEAQVVGTTISRGVPVTVPEEKKKEGKTVVAIEVRETKVSATTRTVRFKAFDTEDKPVKGAVIEIFDDKLPNGSAKLSPTDDSGITTYEVTIGKAREKYFAYSCGNVYNTKRLWR